MIDLDAIKAIPRRCHPCRDAIRPCQRCLARAALIAEVERLREDRKEWCSIVSEHEARIAKLEAALREIQNLVQVHSSAYARNVYEAASEALEEDK